MSAVFLSYASEDAAAAMRIRDALQAAGVEVWFDQSELRGGDAWDSAIRKRIKECAFFVPVIKRLVRAVDFRGAQRLAQEALELATVKEVKGLLFEGMRELGVIDVMEMYH